MITDRDFANEGNRSSAAQSEGKQNAREQT